jgi:hypothetical protein
MVYHALLFVRPFEQAVRVGNAKNREWEPMLMMKGVDKLLEERTKRSVARLGIQGMIFLNRNAVMVFPVNRSARRNKNQVFDIIGTACL